MTDVTFTRETITPEKAAEYLESNMENQRNLARKRVQKMADDIREGRWRDNGETVKFDSRGHLCDGQHRMQAIVLAGIPVDMMVARNVDSDAVVTIDSGKSRSASDALRIAGMGKYSTDISYAAVLIAQWEEKGKVTKFESDTNQKIVSWCQGGNRHEILVELSEYVRTLKSMRRLWKGGVFLTYVYVLFQIDEEKAREFLGKLENNTLLGDKDGDVMIQQFRTRLENERMSRGSISPRDKLKLAISAWNHWLVGNDFQLRTPANMPDFKSPKRI